MEVRKVDVAVIGAGTAGLNARRQAEKLGASVLMIESGAYGTTCARVGCMPSKLLIAAADAAHQVRGAGRFGVHADDLRIDGPAVLERVRRERDRFVGFVVEDTEAIPESQRLRGSARFTGETTLEVGGHSRVEARAVVVASGTTPVVPPPFENLGSRVLVNDDIFEMEDLPASLAVIGTGVIGLELGQALSRLGVRVALFNRSGHLGLFTDPVLRRVSREVFAESFPLHLDAEVLEARETGEGVAIRWRAADGAEHAEAFEAVLAAAGRRPNLASLDFERTGLALDAQGLPSWDPSTAQCADAAIFLAGDVSGHRNVLHEASDEGRIAGGNAASFPDVAAHVRREKLAIVFTDPQMAMLGTFYQDLDLERSTIGEISYEDQGRARVMGANRGLVRLYADRPSCRLVGAEMFGPRVEHMAHLLAWSVQQGMTVQEILRMPFYHPVVEEGLRTGLRELAKGLRVVAEARCEDMADAPAC
jgi:dihydrolipoamide dehydrogenase